MLKMAYKSNYFLHLINGIHISLTPQCAAMPRRKKSEPKLVKREKQIKRDFSDMISDFQMSRISDFDSHMSPHQMSDFDPYCPDSNDSLEEEIAYIPRRQINLHDDFEEARGNLKYQQERINVEEEEDQIYQVTKSKNSHNYHPLKVEKENRKNLAALIIQKLDHDSRKNNANYGKVLYRIKQERTVGDSEPSYELTSGHNREVLQICD